MTKYREIIRLAGLNLSQTNIALSCNASKTTVNKVLKAAREQHLVWPLDPKLSDPVLGKLLFPEVKAKSATSKRMPDFEHVRKELLRNGVNKKLLWTEYLEECRLSKEEPLMYSLGRRDLSGCFSVHICAFHSSYSSYFAFLCTSSKIFRAKIEPTIFLFFNQKLFINQHKCFLHLAHYLP